MAAGCSTRGIGESLLAEYHADENLCDPEPEEVHPLIVHLTSNYIIVRSILSHLGWREQASCAQVCRLWRDTVKSLQRDYLQSYDFVVNVREDPALTVVTTLSERPLLARPLFAIAFYNTRSLKCEYGCHEFAVTPCTPPCGKKHDLLTGVEYTLMSKDADLLGVVCSRLIYMPSPNAMTAHFTLRNKKLPIPFLAGLYIPKIPNVMCHTLQYRNRLTVQQDIYDEVDEICATQLIKGLIVFVEDRLMLLDDDNLDFLDYFKRKQPDIPFAMGGCVVEMASKGTLRDRDAPVTLTVVTVLRQPETLPAPGPRSEFYMYSQVLERTVFKKEAINKAIQTFAQSIPDLEFSAALKLSCVGRECLHNVEQDRFRACFPRTPLLGCYGNGELGYNVPLPPSAAKLVAPPIKRPRNGLPDFCYSYSTVFVYLGWGKVRRPRANSE